MSKRGKICVLVVLAVIGLHGGGPLMTQAPMLATTEANRERLEALMRAFREGRAYVPNEVLVQFRSGVPQSSQLSTLRVLRGDVRVNNPRWIGDTLLLSGLANEDPERAAEVLERQPEVQFAQPNYIRRPYAIPNDTSYSSQWHMDLIRMPQAWEIARTAASGVTVAVLDSGLTKLQGTFGFRVWTGTSFGVFGVPFAPVPDFDHSRVRRGVEFTVTGPWTTGGQQVLWDADGHGTHVAGTAAQQTNNNLGYAGVASGATLLPVKVCSAAWDFQLAFGVLGIPGRVPPDAGGCTDADIAAGIRHAVDNGAQVINISIGGPQAAPIAQQALQYAVQRGVFVSIAAGNSGHDGNPTNYPAAYAAQLDGVVAVGAVTRNRERAFYSSFGPYVELVAPGGALNAGPVNDIWQVFPDESDLDITRQIAPSFTRYVGKGIAGTSMASPHVAGIAALLYSQGITSPAAIEHALTEFAVDLGPAGRDDQYGFGLIDARASLRGLGVAK